MLRNCTVFGFVPVALLLILLSMTVPVDQVWAKDWSQAVRTKITSVTTSSMIVKWSVPDSVKGSRLTLYSIEHGKVKKIKSMRAGCKSFRVKGLKRNKSYRFVVKAKDSDGKVLSSDVATSKTSSLKKSRNAIKVKSSKSKLSLRELQRIKISAKPYARKGKKPISNAVRYYSSNSKIATVDSSGRVAGVSAGKCRIYCVAHNGVAKSVKVTVSQGVLVLGYHGVATPSEKKKLYSEERFTITTVEFERQIKLLHDKGYRSLTCEEFYRWQTGKLNLQKRSVLITFDDGRYSAVQNAPAILDKYGMKSTWFIIGERTVASDQRNPNRYTATVADLNSMRKQHPACDFQGHSYGLHKDDSNGKHLIFSKTDRDVKKDCELMNRFSKKLGCEGFDFYAYPYGSDPVWYRDGLKASGIKMSFDFGKDQLASRLDSRWSIKRVGVRENTTYKMFLSFVM